MKFVKAPNVLPVLARAVAFNWQTDWQQVVSGSGQCEWLS